MITILQITPSYKPAYIYGGPTRSIAKLCEELLTTHFQVKVLTTTANGVEELSVETKKVTKVDQVDVQYFKRITKDHTHFSPTLLWELIKQIKTAKRQPTHQLLIHIHSWWNTIALSSLLISRWYGVPVVLSARGMITSYSFKNRNSFYKKLIHQVLGRRLLENLCIHATTTKEASDINSLHIRYKKIFTIPNLVNVPALPKHRVVMAPMTSALNLLFLSRIEEKKGLLCLFTALSTLTLPWKLTIAGSGHRTYIAQLKKLAEVLNINQRLTWLGDVKDKDKFPLLNKSDFLILPSFNENFANVVIESLSVGTPVILSQEVGLADYIVEKNIGWVTTADPLSLTKCIHMAALDHKKRAFIKKEAPRIIHEDYSTKAILSNYINMYEQILNYGC